MTKDDIIDSRDIIRRFEELDSNLDDLKDAIDEAVVVFMLVPTDENAAAYMGANLALATWIDEEEYNDLKALIEEAEDYGDWHHGETLIREDYFVKYIEELINDCYEIPKSEGWPYHHMTMDYEAAAEEAKADYNEVDFGGTTYLIRA